MDDAELLPSLTVVSGALRGVSFRIAAGSRVIGRAETADIVIADSQVSRRHAAVRLSGGQVCLADMGSTNGTWLNEERLAGRALLVDGDRIRLGGVELRFCDPASAVTVPVNDFRHLAGAVPRQRHPRPGAAGVDNRTPTHPDSLTPAGVNAAASTLAGADAAASGPGRPTRVLVAVGAGLAAIGGLTGAYLLLQ